MTTLRSPRRSRATTAFAGLLAAAAILLTANPAAADPSPVPSAPAAPAVPAPPTTKPGSITWAVQASSQQGPDGRKAFSYVDIKPGTVLHDYVGVTNFSAMPVTFSVYATDAFTDKNGDYELLAADKKPQDVGAWTAILKNSVTLAPGERANEPITLTVPSTATPGDHSGGIIASVTVDAKNSQGTTVKVDRRLAVPLYLRVAGPLNPGLTIESVSSHYHGTLNPIGGGAADVTYIVHNTGNIRLDLSQEVTVKGLFGLKIASGQAKSLANLLPGATYQATVHLSNVFPLGPMSVDVRGVPTQVAGIPEAQPKPAAVSIGVSMWATPWLLILVVIVLVGGFFGVRWLLRWRRDRRNQTVASAVAKARRDTVEALKKRAAAAKAEAGKADAGKADAGKAEAGAGRGAP